MSQMTKISAVRYAMTEGGTITVSPRNGGGWNLAFAFGGDSTLDFTETAGNVPEWMAVVKDYCGWPAASVTID